MSQLSSSVPLVGRDGDIAVIRSFVDQAATRGGALVVSGEAGVGKTALLEAATSDAVAAGLCLLRVTGAQFGANVSFSGLHQLLFPLLGAHLDQLDDVHRTALDSALGLRDGPAPEWLTLAHAALELLTRAASDTPILIVVDDVPWLDKASGRVLAFIARRTAGTRLGFLATMRTGEEGLFDRAGIGAYELRPLSHASSEALLDSRYPALTARARYRLLSEAQGNPLALLELPIALHSQHAGADIDRDAAADEPAAGGFRRPHRRLAGAHPARAADGRPGRDRRPERPGVRRAWIRGRRPGRSRAGRLDLL